MIKLRIYALAFSTVLNLTIPGKINPLEENKNLGIYQQDLEDVTIDNPYISYEEIERLVVELSQKKIDITKHKKNNVYDVKRNEILWDSLFQVVKNNNQKYLIENKEKKYLVEFSDTELKEILKNIQVFIQKMEQEYLIDKESTACKLNDLEIIKDTRIPALEVPYFDNYEGRTQTMTLLEDWDLDYYKITQAEETFHLLQGPCKEIDEDVIKQSVWMEPLSYSKKQIPSPLRTITLDEYIAKVNAIKINPDYEIDLPNFSLLNLLELSLLPNKNYVYQDTLTKLSIHQNMDGFYNLFHASSNEEKVEVHKKMHNLDLISGYFQNEVDWNTCPIEELLKIEVLEFNKVLFQNLLLREEKYEENHLLHLIYLSREYSLYTLRMYLEELEMDDPIYIENSYLEKLDELEKALFAGLENIYQNPLLYNEYKNYKNNGTINQSISTKNYQLIEMIEREMKEFYQYYEYTK